MDSGILSYDDTVRRITSIDFSVFSNAEVLRQSAFGKDTIGIQGAELYESQEPKKNSLIDTRLGTTNNTRDCDTCGLNDMYCVGHFGHLTLAEHVFHMGYLDFVKKILGCICIRCSKLLVHKNENEIAEMVKTKSGRARLNEIRNQVKNVTYCQKNNYGCGALISKIKLEKKKTTGAITLYVLFSESNMANIKDEGEKINDRKKTRLILTPTIVYNILKNVSDQDCIIMGIDPKKTRPEELIHKHFPIPPVQVRPSVRADHMSSNLMEDDLTHALADIVKANERIAQQSDTDNAIKYSQDYSHLLQYQIAAYEDNDNINGPKSEHKGKPVKSLGPRLKGKEGRVRYNLMGKRVDFSGRTVITSDPTIEINQLGVPVKIAMNLTFPEVVTPNNIEFLSKLVGNGRDVYPGANFVIPASSISAGGKIQQIDLRYKKGKVELQYGDIVERHLLNDDVVLVNRQPTLHKQSMMGHRVKVINNPKLNTFRLSVTVTTPYNADFDGDEMNIFVAESIQSMIELEEIADVKRQVISPASSLTSYGIVQDGLIGTYNLTQADMKIDWKDAMNMMAYTSIDDFMKFAKNKSYTGHELISMVIPSRINVKKGSDNDPEQILIKNGVMERGRLTKALLGAKKKNTLPQLIWDEYGIEETKTFFNDVQRLANNYNLYNGFTIGIEDTFIKKEVQMQVYRLIDTIDTKTNHMITEYENNPETMDIELFERNLYAEYNDVRQEASKIILANFDKTNKFNIMYTCGSKGDADNVSQITALVGMQAFENSMIPKKCNGRSLPYFHKGDDRSEARGLIKSPFRTGMTFCESFYQLMASRSGVIDSAIKTAESGYIQRKLIKFMEDYKIAYDGTVRSALNQIVQFIYGDSGADPTRQYSYELKMLEMSDSTIANKHKFTQDELKKTDISEKVNNELYENILELRDIIRVSQVKTRMDRKTMSIEFKLPVNLQRIVESNKNNVELKKHTSKLEASYVLKNIEEVLEKKTQLMTATPDKLHDTKTVKYRDAQIAKTALRACMYDIISPKRCISEHNLNKHQFDKIICEIVNSFEKNMVEAGEMIGIISAQSMGECVTQLTLKAFHFAGISQIKSTTQGVPRIKELLSLSKNIKTPQMLIFMTKGYREDADMAKKISSHIEYTTIGHLVSNMEVYFDPNPYEKNGFIETDRAHKVFTTKTTSKLSCQSDMNAMPWLLRITFNREKMLEREVTMIDIKSKLCHAWEKRNADKGIKKEDRHVFENIIQIGIMSNTDFDKVPILHLRFDMYNFEISKLNAFIDMMIENFKLKGNSSMTSSKIVSERLITFDNPNGEMINVNQNTIYANGSNLYDIRYINNVDIYNTVCNDVNEMYKCFGIEAARSTLLSEITFAYERGGQTVNYHHLGVLIDLMTFDGTLISIDRYGINKTDAGPLMRASFEKTVEILLSAAVFSESDNLNGVSSRIMCGLTIKGGTGLCNLYLDYDMVQNSEYTEDIGQKYIKTYNDINVSSIIADTLNNDIEDDIFIPM